MLEFDPKIMQVLSPEDDDREWEKDLQRMVNGDITLTRHSAGESSIKAVQRILVFLGYSTATTGAFLIDGDFGRGTNRGIAQFQFEHNLNPKLTLDTLCYPCRFQNAASRITAIPDVILDIKTLEKMVHVVNEAIVSKSIPLGDFDPALFHLNALQKRQLLNCRAIEDRYGDHAKEAVEVIWKEKSIRIDPKWVLTIIKQETSGIIRPRFEQHKLSGKYKKSPTIPFPELRIQSMSIGLGQIMGFNFKHVGAPSAMGMLYSPIEEQILYIARYLSKIRNVKMRSEPTMTDFRDIARAYNGPLYEKHFYHEKLQRWFKEFQHLESHN